MRFRASEDPREFWLNVLPEGCWEWAGARDKDGYGQTRSGTGRVKAHRKVWEMLHGAVPPRMLVLHSCDNPPCVRPNHLYVGSHLDNQLDKWARGRGVIRQGGDNTAAKLTEQAVIQIRERYDTGTIRQRDLGAEFGVDQSVISSIVNRKTWKHVR